VSPANTACLTHDIVETLDCSFRNHTATRLHLSAGARCEGSVVTSASHVQSMPVTSAHAQLSPAYGRSLGRCSYSWSTFACSRTIL
jgi:hypothetical protein